MIDSLKEEGAVQLAMPGGHGEDTKDDEEEDDNTMDP